MIKPLNRLNLLTHLNPKPSTLQPKPQTPTPIKHQAGCRAVVAGLVQPELSSEPIRCYLRYGFLVEGSGV